MVIGVFFLASSFCSGLGSGFGLFTFAGRSTAFLGPLMVGTLTYFISQRVGLLAVLPLFILGYVILQNLEVDESY